MGVGQFFVTGHGGNCQIELRQEPGNEPRAGVDLGRGRHGVGKIPGKTDADGHGVIFPGVFGLGGQSLESVEKLSGGRIGQHSIRINKQWRICFEWRENEAYAVEIVDYH